VELTAEVGICSQSVTDTATCEPGGTGSARWQKNDNFDVFSVSDEATAQGWEAELNEVRLRYLGTPYYDGAVHLECKANITLGQMPVVDNPMSDSIDLTATMKSEVVNEVTASAIVKLSGRGYAFSAELQDKFKSALRKSVEDNASVKYLWFLVKWTGGRDSISRNSAFQSCLDDVKSHEDKPGGASLVTGVAGLLLLENKIDTSITGESTVTNALSLTFGGALPQPVATASADIGSEWKHSIGKRFSISGRLEGRSQTVYPLWIQFE
jgi:hypothetical protein